MMCVCGRGLSLEFITSAVCAFQSTNRPQVAAGVYFQGSLAVIPFTFVIAKLLGPIIFFPRQRAFIFILSIYCEYMLVFMEHVALFPPHLTAFHAKDNCNRKSILVASKTTDYPRIFSTNCAKF